MKYNLFLFDLDDTLLDFKESERLSFYSSLHSLGVESNLDELYRQYQKVNEGLWKLFEQGKTSKEHLKVERFRHIFASNKIEIDPELASNRYLDSLPNTVVLMDDAKEVCEWLTQFGEIGIITNGIHHVQTQRIKNSHLAPFISFVSVSEECGFAKPDIRFFEYTAKKARNFSKSSSLVIGDRIEADILGAKNFNIDSCWFNPRGLETLPHLIPTYEIKRLADLKKILATT